MKSFSLLVLIASVSFIAGAGLTYVSQTRWASDMANQPSIKPQERPLLPPENSVATDLIGGNPGGSVTIAGKEADHQAEERGHEMAGAAGHQHDSSAAKHDHGEKQAIESSKKDSSPVAKDLLGSAGTGPGKILQSPQDKEKTSDPRADNHEHGSKAKLKAPAKDVKPNHSSTPHNHAPGAGHDHGSGKTTTHEHGSKSKRPAKGSGHDQSTAPHSHGPEAPHDHNTGKSAGHSHSQSAPHRHDTAAHSHGEEKAGRTKSKASPTVHQHGPGEGAGHSHDKGGGQAHGEMHSQARVVNPLKPTEASVKKGQQLFNIYCSVCHGSEGRGGMPMESQLTGIPKFTPELLRSVDDAHMFSMVTSGHGPMPGYAEALSPEERWHVTNYVRTLQNKLADKNHAPVGARR